jgi:hypothetical protein
MAVKKNREAASEEPLDRERLRDTLEDFGGDTAAVSTGRPPPKNKLPSTAAEADE